MKISLVFIALLYSFAASAYEYSCHLTSDYQDTVQIRVTKAKLTMFDQYDAGGTGRRGAISFRNKGLVGGQGKMKNRFSFQFDYSISEVLPGDITEYFLSPELTTGGFKLRNGAFGGYMTFAGHGYSYESFICFLKQ